MKPSMALLFVLLIGCGGEIGGNNGLDEVTAGTTTPGGDATGDPTTDNTTSGDPSTDDPAVIIGSTSNGSGDVRAIGLDYTPSYVASYDTSKDIPSNALDASAYSSLDAWLDDCVKKDVAGKIGSGSYTVAGTERVAPRGIYGYGKTMPVITASSRAAWLFVHSNDFKARYIAFKNFGTVLAGSRPTTPLKNSDGSIDTTPYHSYEAILARVWVDPGKANATRTMTRVGKITLTGGSSGAISKVAVTRPVLNALKVGEGGNKAAIEDTFDILGKTVNFDSSLAKTATAVAAAITASGKGYTARADDTSVIIEKASDYGLTSITVTTSGLKVTADTSGPAVDIQHATFTDVDMPVYFISDTTAPGRIDYSGNTHTGTWGGVYLGTTRWTDLYAANNVWKDATGARAQPSVSNNGTNTLLGLGTNAAHYVGRQKNIVLIENNEVSNIESVQMRTDINAAVMADIRNGVPAVDGAISVSFNKVKHFVNLRGHEDTNVVYGKCAGILIERNYFEDFGAGNVKSAGYEDGSETNGILLKEPGVIERTGKTIIRGNTLVGAPANIPVVKVMDFGGYLEVSFNEIKNWEAPTPVDNGGAIKYYGPLGSVAIFGNVFTNTPTTGYLINVHQPEELKTGSQLRIDNNTATGSYTADKTFIRVGQELSSSFLGGMVLGSNTLVNGSKKYVMQMTDASGVVAESSQTVTAEIYTPPKE